MSLKIILKVYEVQKNWYSKINVRGQQCNVQTSIPFGEGGGKAANNGRSTDNVWSELGMPTRSEKF